MSNPEILKGAESEPEALAKLHPLEPNKSVELFDPNERKKDYLTFAWMDDVSGYDEKKLKEQKPDNTATT